MKVLIDTSIWSAALRKQTAYPEQTYINSALSDLIKDARVLMMGVIRQEILSGIKSIDQFEKLKSYLRAFPDLMLEMKDFEMAASFYNQCRGRGIQGSHIDFLISAVAINRSVEVFTLDRDFENYAKYIPLKLYKATPL